MALVEVVSPSNKDRRRSVQEFVAKVWGALMTGVHVTVLDLHPPRRADPGGLPGVIWTGFAGPRYKLPADKPLTFAAFKAGGPVEGFFTHLAVGDRVPDAPLFLTPAYYVNLPLATTYEAAFRGLPEYWRQVLDAPAS